MNAKKTVLALGVAIALLTLLALAPIDRAEAKHGSLIGSWRVSIGPPEQFCFPSYFVFHADRTMTERSGFLTDTTSSGAWHRIGFGGNYAATFEGFQEFPPDSGEMIGFRVRLTIRVNGNELIGTATGDELDWKTGEFVETFAAGLPVEGTRVTVRRE